MTHTFLFLRHGLSSANSARIVQGQRDSPLSKEGITQVRTLAEAWRQQSNRPDLIISSPLRRALETAQILARSLEIDIEIDETWQEMNLGAAEGMAYSDFAALYQNQPPAAYEQSFETGETPLDLYIRASKAIQALVLRPPGVYLVIAHGGVIAGAIRSILGLAPAGGRVRPPRFALDNAAYAEMQYEASDARWTFVRSNATQPPARRGIE